MVEAEIDGEQAAQGTGSITLVPGMPVEVFIQTVERSPISYLVKPLTDFFSRSLRD